MKKTLTLTFLLALISNAFAQHSEIRGHVYDELRNPVEFAVVQLVQGDKILYLVESASDGSFQMKTVQSGTYLFKVVTISGGMYSENMRLTGGQIQVRDSIFISESGYSLGEAKVRPKVSSEPVVEITDSTIAKLPSIDPIDVAVLNPGTEFRNGRIQVGKGKSDGTVYLGDGNVPVIGPAPISNLGLESIQILDIGVSARFGGFTGGAVQFRTSPISLKNSSTLQIQTSSPFNAYHHNLASFYFSKALKSREINGTQRSKLVLGYSFTGNYKYQKDVSPAINGFKIASQETMDYLVENPLSSSEVVGGFVPSASFITDDDLEHSFVRPNANRHDISGQLKLSFNPGTRIKMDLINSYNYLHRRLPLANNVVFNSDENPLQQYHFVNSQFNFTHRLKAPYSEAGKLTRDTNDLFSSIFYSLEINHQYSQSSVMSHRHRDNLFDYGYVGKYETMRVPVYQYQNDKRTEYSRKDGTKATVANYWELTGYRDSLVGFQKGSQNPALASYTEFIYGTLGSNVSYQNLIQRGGLQNGQNLPLLYSLYANPGTTYGSYSKSYQQRIGVTAYAEAALHPFRNPKLQHDLEFGMSFQQDKRGYYNLNASSLWQLMPLLANQHIQNLDVRNPTGSEDHLGRFTDSISYNTWVDYDGQKHFDKRLREALTEASKSNTPVDDAYWIDVNALDPALFNLSMFSADELLNDGNGYVSYSGYDHLGNKRGGKKGLSSFLNDPLNRPVDGFNPITASAWIQDKFVFRQLIMRAGFRFERYDANQNVLKDPYLVYPGKQAGEVSNLAGVSVKHPSSIKDNYAVYVNDASSPTEIVGYRNQHQWFDANGKEVNDPSLLANASSSGRIQPYLIDPQNQNLTSHSFTSYKPQNLILPRISFSFPINSRNLVFMSYDQLAQNPDPSLNYLPFTTYYFMQSNISRVIPNPELKARVKTEYNLGFKQHIGDYASLNLTASYATVKNDFNQFRLEGAYPYSYTTYSNIDFSAIKRYIAEYQFTNNHITLSASYALQFADGTGSNVNSAASLIQSGQPNLRSFFPLSFDNRHTLKGFAIYSFGADMGKQIRYKGPTIGGRQILKNAFVSLSFQSLSGYPYSQTLQPVSEAQAGNGVVQRTQLKGNPFGNRLEWRHISNFRFEKAFKTRSLDLSGYVVVSNLFNLKLVESVYSYTGQPGDDGYLNSPQGQQQVRNQIDAQTFTTLYKLRMNNPNNFGAPRNVQLGIRLSL